MILLLSIDMILELKDKPPTFLFLIYFGHKGLKSLQTSTKVLYDLFNIFNMYLIKTTTAEMKFMQSQILAYHSKCSSFTLMIHVDQKIIIFWGKWHDLEGGCEHFQGGPLW